MDIKTINKIISMIKVEEKDGKITSIQVSAKPNTHPFHNELKAYLKGELEQFSFDFKVDASLSDFQRSVLTEILKIPYGQTRTYQDIALAIDNPKASMAVGTVCARNKLLFLIPCHRVISKNQGVGDYQLGRDIKALLLELEHKKTHQG